jgi:DMSO/TMAO reductase YedYZ molybdopterin-dependent catalytic subunit
MSEQFVSRGFQGKRTSTETRHRLPPGQHIVNDFPVLSAGPTPRVPLDQWRLTLDGLVQEPITWSWQEFLELPSQEFVVDIHCVTSWSKLDTRWRGVSMDTLLKHVTLDPRARYLTADCYGDYTTNLPIDELLNGQAFVAYQYNGQPLPREHGGPARLVVPHLYFWKSAKWLRGLRFMERDVLGFWETLGYHEHGDPWKEERYSGSY